jgi:hypothetical protein
LLKRKKLAKNNKTGKYFEKSELSYFVKNEKYHTIKFKETSCGLKSDWMETAGANNKINKKKDKVIKDNQTTTKVSKKEEDTIIEEYLIVPVDYEIKDGQFEVTDKKIKDKIIEVVKNEKGIELSLDKNEVKEEIPVISYDIDDKKVDKLVESNKEVKKEVKDKKKVKEPIKISNKEIPTSIFSSFEEDELPQVVEPKKEVKKEIKDKDGIFSKISSYFNKKKEKKTET